MNALFQFLRSVTGIFRWWVIIAPWEDALRVRLGKHVKEIGPGIHLKIPFIDMIFRKSTRYRVMDLQTQTMTTADGKTITVGGAVGFSIGNVKQLYDTLHDPEATVQNLAASKIAQCIHTTLSHNCTPAYVEAEASKDLNGERWGLKDLKVLITDFAAVRTYRLIQDQRSTYYAGGLNTTTPDGSGGEI